MRNSASSTMTPLRPKVFPSNSFRQVPLQPSTESMRFFRDLIIFRKKPIANAHQFSPTAFLHNDHPRRFPLSAFRFAPATDHRPLITRFPPTPTTPISPLHPKMRKSNTSNHNRRHPALPTPDFPEFEPPITFFTEMSRPAAVGRHCSHLAPPR
jgi:hypothetical protein